MTIYCIIESILIISQSHFLKKNSVALRMIVSLSVCDKHIGHFNFKMNIEMKICILQRKRVFDHIIAT